MPLYSFICTHGHKSDAFAKVAERNELRQCVCGAVLTRVLAAPVAHVMQGYTSPVTGRWINSLSARREDLKRAGCIEWEPGIRQDLPRIRESNLDKQIAPLEATIEETARRLVATGEMSPL